MNIKNLIVKKNIGMIGGAILGLIIVLAVLFTRPNSRLNDEFANLAPTNTESIISVNLASLQNTPTDTKLENTINEWLNTIYFTEKKLNWQYDLKPYLEKRFVVLILKNKEKILIFKKNTSVTNHPKWNNYELANYIIFTDNIKNYEELSKISQNLHPSWGSRNSNRDLYQKFYREENIITTITADKNYLANFLPTPLLATLPNTLIGALKKQDDNFITKTNLTPANSNESLPFSNLPANTLLAMSGIKLDNLLPLKFIVPENLQADLLLALPSSNKQFNIDILEQWAKYDFVLKLSSLNSVTDEQLKSLSKNLANLLPETRTKILPDGTSVKEKYINYNLINFSPREINQSTYNYFQVPQTSLEILWKLENSELTISNSQELIKQTTSAVATESSLNLNNIAAKCGTNNNINGFVNFYYLTLENISKQTEMPLIISFLSNFKESIITENGVCLVN